MGRVTWSNLTAWRLCLEVDKATAMLQLPTGVVPKLLCVGVLLLRVLSLLWLLLWLLQAFAQEWR